MIKLKYCQTKNIVAEVPMKGLARARHQRLVVAFGLEDFGYLQSGRVEVG